MIYNPSYKSNPLPSSTVWASLETMDGKAAFNFLVNPETIKWQHNSNFNSLNVLRSSQPLASYQYSQTTLSIPSCHLWTPNNNGSISKAIDLLKVLTKPVKDGGLPPMVNFIWGNTKETRLHLVSLDITETQWRSGEPTQAECGMAFIHSPILVIPKDTTPKPTTRQKAKPATTKAKPKTTKISSNGDIIGDLS